MIPQQLPAVHVMVTRTDVQLQEDRAIIVLSCGHTIEAKPHGLTTLEQTEAILRRHIGKSQPCYKCEAVAKAQEVRM